MRHYGLLANRCKAYTLPICRQGYSWDTARRHLRAVGRFSAWAQTAGLSYQELGTESLEQFKDALEVKGPLRYL